MHTISKTFLVLIFLTISNFTHSSQSQSNGVEPERKKMAADQQNGMGGMAKNDEYYGVDDDLSLSISREPRHIDKIIAKTIQQSLGNGTTYAEEFSQTQREMPKAKPTKSKLPDGLAESVIDNSDPLVKKAIYRLKSLPIGHISRPKGMLLIGPSGTGKTTLAAAIAKECNVQFFPFGSTEIGNEWQKSSDSNILTIFQEARDLDTFCVVAIDEFQTLVSKAKNPHDPESTMLQTLWMQLDKYENNNIFFIGMLNAVDDIPDTIISRFKPFIISVPLPNFEQRKRVLEYCLQQQKNRVEISQIMQPAKLAASTNGFNCRDLAKIFCDACQLAVEENDLGKKPMLTKPIVTMKHFQEALEMDKKASHVAKQEPGFLSRLGTNMANSAPRIIEGVLLKLVCNYIDDRANTARNKEYGIDPYQQQKDYKDLYKEQKDQNAINKQRSRVEAEQMYNSRVVKDSEKQYVELQKFCEMLEVPQKNKKNDGDCIIQ